MTDRWAILMPPASAPAAWSLRTRPGIRCCALPDGLWLQGEDAGEDLECRLKILPITARYTIDSEDRITSVGGLVPVGRLPTGPWRDLRTLSSLEPQTASLPGTPPAPQPVRLVRSERPAAPNLLLTSMDLWAGYAESASRVRLGRLSFAVSDDGRAAVCGTPTPPIPGQRFVATHGVAVPCGFALQPDIGTALLADLLQLQPDDRALLFDDGTCEIISAGSFVQASRSAVRLSRGGRDDH